MNKTIIIKDMYLSNTCENMQEHEWMNEFKRDITTNNLKIISISDVLVCKPI